MVNGFGSGILWVSQGKYVAQCATEETKGFFFSYFFGIFMVSQILGNLIAAFVLKYSGQPTYYIVMTILSALGSMVFLTLRKPEKQIESKEQKRIQNGSTLIPEEQDQ